MSEFHKQTGVLLYVIITAEKAHATLAHCTINCEQFGKLKNTVASKDFCQFCSVVIKGYGHSTSKLKKIQIPKGSPNQEHFERWHDAVRGKAPLWPHMGNCCQNAQNRGLLKWLNSQKYLLFLQKKLIWFHKFTLGGSLLPVPWAPGIQCTL